MNSNKFADLVAEYRMRNRDGNKPLSLEKTAERFGVSRVSLNAWLNGDAQPSLSKAVHIADVLGVTLDELAGRCADGR